MIFNIHPSIYSSFYTNVALLSVHIPIWMLFFSLINGGNQPFPWELQVAIFYIYRNKLQLCYTNEESIWVRRNQLVAFTEQMDREKQTKIFGIYMIKTVPKEILSNVTNIWTWGTVELDSSTGFVSSTIDPQPPPLHPLWSYGQLLNLLDSWFSLIS